MTVQYTLEEIFEANQSKIQLEQQIQDLNNMPESLNNFANSIKKSLHEDLDTVNVILEYAAKN